MSFPPAARALSDALIVDLPYSSGGLHYRHAAANDPRKYQGARIQHRRQDFDGDQRDQLSFRTWATDVLRLSYRTLKRSAVFATFIDWRQLAPMILAVQCAGFTPPRYRRLGQIRSRPPTPGASARSANTSSGAAGRTPAQRGVPILPASCAPSSGPATSIT